MEDEVEFYDIVIHSKVTKEMKNKLDRMAWIRRITISKLIRQLVEKAIREAEEK